MLEAEAPVAAIRLAVPEEIAFWAKALRPPRMNATTPAMITTRKVPSLRGCSLELTDVNICLIFQALLGGMLYEHPAR